MKVEFTKVKGSNVSCPLCYWKVNTEPHSAEKHKKGEEVAKLPKDTPVLKLSIDSESSRGRSCFLCKKCAIQFSDKVSELVKNFE